MGLSRRARRGIAAFNKIQSSDSRVRYMMRKLMVEAPRFAANILNAAQAAAEAIHASIQIVPESENNAVPTNAEGGAKLDVPGESENVKETPKRAPGGIE